MDIKFAYIHSDTSFFVDTMDLYDWWNVPPGNAYSPSLVDDPFWGLYLELKNSLGKKDSMVRFYFIEMNLVIGIGMLQHRQVAIRQLGLLWLERYDNILYC